MKILIDADGCPVVDLAIKIAKNYNIEIIIMCDTSHMFNKPGVETIVISKGIDSVDFALVNRVNKDDIVITQDYGLAAMVLSKNGYAINQNGLIYNDENIERLLFTRHLSKKVRNSGGKLKGPKKRQKEDDIKFEQSLIYLIETASNVG
ncbi:MAG: YaiI/YqxD family protein [Peptostreptococcaceae bacterium]